jgi:hypothetical protein
MSKNNPYQIGSLEHRNYERYGAPCSPFAGMMASSRAAPPVQSCTELTDQGVLERMLASEKELKSLRKELSRRCEAAGKSTDGMFSILGAQFVPRAIAEKWQDEAEAKYRACKKKLDALTEPARRAEAELGRTQAVAARILEAHQKATGQIPPDPWIPPVQPAPARENTPEETAAAARRMIAADRKRRGLSD